MSTAEVYAFCAERAISARILMNLSMDQKLRSVYKLLFIYGSSLVVVAEGMIMVYLIARGHRHGRKVPLRSYSQPVRSVAGKVPFSR
ncbi:hypothetical protein EHN11_11640 [Salmonella enterica]|nr:hypothetical protein [Salmonella enterica]